MPNAPGGNGSGPEPAQPDSSPILRRARGKRGEEGFVGEAGMTIGKLKLPYDLSLEITEHWKQMRVHDAEATLTDAVRELLRIGTSSVPEEGVLLAARDRGFNRQRHWDIERGLAHYREMVADLERELSLEVLRGTPDKR